MWDGLVVTPNVFIDGIFVPYTYKNKKRLARFELC